MHGAHERVSESTVPCAHRRKVAAVKEDQHEERGHEHEVNLVAKNNKDLVEYIGQQGGKQICDIRCHYAEKQQERRSLRDMYSHSYAFREKTFCFRLPTEAPAQGVLYARYVSQKVMRAVSGATT